ncbi:MAG: ATP-binding cassette domain-containing protein [bacterium]
MLTFSNLSLRRGAKALFSSVTLQIHTGQRVGLTGANGTGKSSLFALLRGELLADEGDVKWPSTWVIAHVKQETPAVTQTALAYTLAGDEEYTEIQQALSTLQAPASGADHHASDHTNGQALAEWHSRLEAIDGYQTESRAAALLHGLGFSHHDLQKSVTDFSGGWRMRLNLAQALMCRSDLLLLDEPTNHLDLDAVIWLQDWLQAYSGTLLLISHDREFLDATTQAIAHIEHGQLRLYRGNYSAFENKRAELLAQQQAAYQKQQREIAHIQRFVERFRAKATKAKQAQSRVKMLERMERISAAQVDSPFNFRFQSPDKLPHQLFQAKQVQLAYGEKVILDQVSIKLTAGARIGLIGANGAGKSTLIKFLADELTAASGEVVTSPHLHRSYFAQHQLEQLSLQDSALDHFRRLDPQASEQSLRDYLGGFAFHNERIEAPIAPFSGGEKARLVLALLVYQRPNVLLLDEPTNHLDLAMRHALSVALQSFEGALVLVSHDRHLLKTVTDELILVHDGKAVAYQGDLDDYAVWLKQYQSQRHVLDNEAVDQASTAQKAESVRQTMDVAVSKKQKRQQDAVKRQQLQPLKKAVTRLEKTMETLEQQRSQLDEQLADSTLYQATAKQRLQQLLQEKGELDKQWEDLELAWLEASEAYEEALNKIA